MFSIAFTTLFGQDTVNRRPAYAEGGFGFIESLRSSDVLPNLLFKD